MKTWSKLVISGVLFGAVMAQGLVAATAQERKRTPALREQVYSQLARAQEAADNGQVQEGLAILRAVEGKADSMNSYERAMLWNFYGYLYYEQDDMANAIQYFSKVVDESPIPESLEQNTLYSLAQLSLGQGNYDQVLSYLDRWQALVGDEQANKADVLRAQALYQQGDFNAALTPIKRAIERAEAEGGFGDENWYVLIRAIYYELEQTEQVANVLETMVRGFNKPEYWLQLAGVYGQLERDKLQLAMLETAYQQGFLTEGRDLQNLAQAYFFNDVPFKAGQVLERGIAEGKIDANLRNLKMLAQSWVAANESDKAAAVLAKASALEESGELDAQRAQILLNTEQNEAAIAAAQRALEKGGLESPGTMHLVIGMAKLNLLQFNEALQAFAEAKKFEDARTMARQWERYAESEKQQAAVLAELRS